MITILQLLNILETEFGELLWTVCPNLELGILSANTFELSKKPEKLELLCQKLNSKTQNLEHNFGNDKEKTEEKPENQENITVNPQPNLINPNSKNPIEIAAFLNPLIQEHLQNLKISTQIKTTGAYINLDLNNSLWQNFLETN